MKCIKCTQERGVEFQRNSTGCGKLSRVCRICDRKRRAEYRARPSFRARNREYQTRYQASDANIKQVRLLQMALWEATPEGRASVAQKSSAYRARRREAIPPWADRNLILAIYKSAAIYRHHGIPCHVDHIVPLTSRRVCGLHCGANLTLMLAADNMRKNNLQWPDMPDYERAR